ncbi:MAG: FCD domain-containing protein [Kiloniellales bacterium]|nr:FCD domain-containing protein [Kiloniellales bacterium]
MSKQAPSDPRPPAADAPPRSAKRPQEICERLKDWIVDHKLKPGDRLPQERELMGLFKASKSTVREALGALQTQGLIRTRTGPGGGAYIEPMDGRRAMELLGNYFFFAQPSIGDIYALRKLLEPEMAGSLAGRLSEADFQRLNATIRLYDHPPTSFEEEYRQRLAELDFHSVLAELCPNPVLGFFCGFLQNLLRNLAICRRIYGTANPDLRESGLNYQVRLLAALHHGNEAEARAIMYDHMCAAQTYMETCEAELTNRFLRLDRR